MLPHARSDYRCGDRMLLRGTAAGVWRGRCQTCDIIWVSLHLHLRPPSMSEPVRLEAHVLLQCGAQPGAGGGAQAAAGGGVPPGLGVWPRRPAAAGARPWPHNFATAHLRTCLGPKAKSNELCVTRTCMQCARLLEGAAILRERDSCRRRAARRSCCRRSEAAPRCPAARAASSSVRPALLRCVSHGTHCDVNEVVKSLWHSSSAAALIKCRACALLESR